MKVTWRSRARRIGTVFTAVSLITVIVFALSQPALAAVTVSTTNVATGTMYSNERHSWYDGTRYWTAYIVSVDASTSAVRFWYCASSSDCNQAGNWTESTGSQISESGAGSFASFSIEADSTNAFIAIHVSASPGAIYAFKACKSTGEAGCASATLYPAAGFTWGSVTTVGAGTGSGADKAPTITKDTNNKLRINWPKRSAGPPLGDYSSILSTNANDISAWGTQELVSSIAVNKDAGRNGNVPLAGGDAYAVWIEDTSINGKKNTAGTWNTNPTSLGTGIVGSQNNVSMVSNTTADEAYLSYIDSGGKTQFRKYIDSENTGWTVPFDHASEGNVTTFTMDTTNNIIYAATGSGGIIYRCDTSTLCDASGDWTQVYDTGDNWMDSSTFDPTNGILYFTAYISAGAAHIYRCDITTTGSCNDSSDWTSYVITNAFASIYMDVANGVLYAGNWANGNMSRCLVSSGCNENADWATYDISTEATIYAITKDTTNNILYAGTGEGGFIYRCDITATSCDAAVDWASAYDTTYTEITNITFDSDNGILYFAAYGSASDGPVLRCNITTTGSCNDSTDYTVSYNPASTDFFSIKADLVNDVIYAGTLAGGIIYGCPTASLCDAAADWSVAYDSATEAGIDDIFSDSSTGILYAGTFNGGQIERYANGWKPPVTLDSNSGNNYVTISRDTVNNILYIFWIRSDVIYYKKCVSPFASANCDASPTTLYTGGTTEAWLTAMIQDGDSKIGVSWLENSATPWNINWATISTILNSAPNTPTLTTPYASGTTVVSTNPALVVNATDPESDSIKYNILIYNTTAQTGGNCSGSSFESQDQNSSQGGWSQSAAYSSGANATYTVVAAMTRGNSYCWQAQGKDPTGSNTLGSLSTPSTFTVNSLPAAPTLILPVAGATVISTQPVFQLRTTDSDSDYLKYNIKVYGNTGEPTNCNNDSATDLIQNVNQYTSQTGWTQQNTQSGSAYTSSTSISNSAIAALVYQPSFTALNQNTTYYWKARAIDPAGVGSDTTTWGAWSSCTSMSFSTAPTEVKLHGNVNIHGNTTIH